MFFCPDDLNVLENFAYGDTPTQPAVAALVGEVFSQGDDFDVSNYDLSAAHDIRFTVVRTLLTYLELLGHIDAGTPFYAEYQFKPLVPSAEILRHFEGERKTFLARSSWPRPSKAKTWFHIDVDQACQAIGAPRDRVVRALDYLAEQKWLELKIAGVRHRYHLRRPAERSAGTGQVALRPRAAAGSSRNPAAPPGCPLGRARRLPGGGLGRPFRRPAWIGPAAIAPGAGGAASRRSCPPRPKTRDRSGPLVAGGQSSSPARQGTRPARCLARFLCGVNSPWMLKAKLQTHPLFGALAHVPFAEVLTQAERLD